VFDDVPDLRGGDGEGVDGGDVPDALRRWLRRYRDAQETEAAMLDVWVDATLQDAALRADAAAAMDWGRRRMARFLAPRGFGDAHAEAVVAVALMSAFGARARTTQDIDAATQVVARGLLGRQEVRP
jgi:hypothetical protein